MKLKTINQIFFIFYIFQIYSTRRKKKYRKIIGEERGRMNFKEKLILMKPFFSFIFKKSHFPK